jgi:hypothetical protein
MTKHVSVVALFLAFMTAVITGTILQARAGQGTPKAINDFTAAYDKIHAGMKVAITSPTELRSRSGVVAIQNGHTAEHGTIASDLPHCLVYLRGYANSISSGSSRIASVSNDQAEGSMTLSFTEAPEIQNITCKSGKTAIIPSLAEVVGTLQGVVTFPSSVLQSLEQ